ncbi:MAG: YIP1 family protein [Clostridia bacterium]|nr:YIP1 family protein [Clostridia bacterium]
MHPVNLALVTLFHPTDAFVVMKRKYKEMSILPSVMIFVLMVVLRYLTILLTHRPLQPMDISDTDLLLQIAVLVLPPLTYVVSAYGVTSVMQGETDFKCFFISTAFCYTPYLVISPLNILLSQVLTLEEAGLYDGIVFLMNLWTIVLLFVALIQMNNYSFGKGVLVAVLSIIGIVLIWIVLILAFAFVFQIVMFVRELLQELQIINV